MGQNRVIQADAQPRGHHGFCGLHVQGQKLSPGRQPVCPEGPAVIRVLPRIGIHIGLCFKVLQGIDTVPDPRVIRPDPGRQRVSAERIKVIVAFTPADNAEVHFVLRQHPVELAAASLKKTDLNAGVLPGIRDPEEQIRLARRAADEGMSVRRLEQLASAAKEKPAKKRRPAPMPAELGELQEKIRLKTGLKSALTGSITKGRIVLQYSSRDELERLNELLDQIQE